MPFGYDIIDDIVFSPCENILLAVVTATSFKS